MWLVRMSAHALADSGAGETPLLPLALLEEAELAGGGPGSQAIHTLCEALLEVGGRGQERLCEGVERGAVTVRRWEGTGGLSLAQ